MKKRTKKSIQEVGDAHKKRVDENIYICDEVGNRVLKEDGTPLMRWEKYDVTLRIASAANNFGGYIVTGVRHYCPIMWMQIDSVGKDVLVEFAGGEEQVEDGFIDQYGRFHDRKAAYIIARDAGQLLPRHEYGETLYSESIV